MNNTKTKYDVFQAIADPKRRKIIKLLADKEMSIKLITQDFNISRTAVNKHLNILYQAELVTKKKSGKETRYKLKPKKLIEVKEWIEYFEKYWDNKLSNLKNYIENEKDN